MLEALDTPVHQRSTENTTREPGIIPPNSIKVTRGGAAPMTGFYISNIEISGSFIRG
jgi:hypothetical protein